LTDGTIFSAQPNPNQLLSVAPVEAFGFLSNSNRPVAIEIQGSKLKVSEGKDLSIIGGDLTIQDSSLQAPGGKINLASVASKGEVAPSSSDWVKNFEKLGKIILSQYPWSPASLDVSSGPAGQISIRAGELFSSNALIFADTSEGDKGGLIDISVEGPISLTHNTLMTADNSTQTSPENQQKSGIIINAKGPLFVGLTQADLDDSTIANYLNQLTTAHTPEQVQKITGGFLQEGIIFSRIGILNKPCVTLNCGSKTGGNISITTPVLEVSYGAIEAATTGSDNAGDIQINASQVNLHDYGYINASIGGSGSGRAGNILLRDGVNPASKISLSNYSSISASTGENTSGEGGKVDLKTRELVLTKVGQINSFSRGSGNAGLINIETDTALLTDDSGIYTKANLASGGNITLNVRDRLVLFNSKITAEARGNGGNLTINARPSNKLKELFAIDNSELRANAFAGNGGDINIRADKYYISRDTVIDFSSELGLNGQFVLNSVKLSDVLPLSKEKDYLKIDSLPLNRCSLSKENQSRFTITARDILPRCPEDLRTQTIRLGK